MQKKNIKQFPEDFCFQLTKKKMKLFNIRLTPQKYEMNH